MAKMVRLGALRSIPLAAVAEASRLPARRARRGVLGGRGLRALITLVTLVACAPAAAQTDTEIDIDTRARALFRTIMSPYCPGSLLNECPSSQAAVLRDSVRARLTRGQTPEQIRQDLVGIYGEEILASPPLQGMGGLAWLGAVVAFLGGLALAALWLRHRRSPPAVAPTAAVDAAGVERVRREIAKLEKE